MDTTYILDFAAIGNSDLSRVGGKNASLGELFNRLGPLGVGVVDGFATTADAYRLLLAQGGLEKRLRSLLENLDVSDVRRLAERGLAARNMILGTLLPEVLVHQITEAYRRLCGRIGRTVSLAVRSSATAEDLPDASFAGQQDTFLNVPESGLPGAVHRCLASLFTDRAISYRAERGYDHFDVALSVGVQPMVRSDIGCAGVLFTLDPESGFRDAVVLSGSYGLGEMVVRGAVTPDEWTVFKPTLVTGHPAIVGRRRGSKERRLVLGEDNVGTTIETTSEEERSRFVLTDDEVLQIARWGCTIEEHYSTLAGRPMPMDIEWAKDGMTGEISILQARPETVHSAKAMRASVEIYHLTEGGHEPLVAGQAVGERIAAGTVRLIRNSSDLGQVEPGDVIVTEMTDPDWEPVLRRVSAIVTDRGGRTAHAAIVSRELGLPCVVGSGNGTSMLQNGSKVTVCCAEGTEGHVYAGEIPFVIEKIDAGNIPQTRTHVMLNVADPTRAFALAAIPNAGVGLARIEFIINNEIGIHPMALVRYPTLANPDDVSRIAARIGEENPRDFFVRRLSEGIGRIAAAFYPKPVIVRTSDFKTNEYARLCGGKEFEPEEENPMLGFRGASRYYDPHYAEGFALECTAIKRVRETLGLTNVKVMIPFCRTVAEAKRVIEVMAENGLVQGANELEVYAMCEIPSNVICAESFLGIFDGYSIGSNDLTQLVLGIDRESRTLAPMFDERNPAVLTMLAEVIATGQRMGKPVGICGQAPSDYPELARWLVKRGITSISLNPDTAIRTAMTVAEAEARQVGTAPVPVELDALS